MYVYIYMYIHLLIYTDTKYGQCIFVVVYLHVDVVSDTSRPQNDTGNYIPALYLPSLDAAGPLHGQLSEVSEPWTKILKNVRSSYHGSLVSFLLSQTAFH